ncbi:hypothetical protein HB829_10730 [Listeria innocua]|nr:hypothetical protein [Listeria innocua]MBC1387862.1 hypothetical protein [Listeria innocua]
MIDELKKYKKIIEDAVDLLGYTPLAIKKYLFECKTNTLRRILNGTSIK